MPSTLVHSENEAAGRPEQPCAHCGLPVGPRPEGDGPLFCCTGCAVAYDALQAAGYGDTYYRLQRMASDRKRARPARTEIDALRLTEMDTEAFLEEHTQPVADGLRRVDLFLDGVHCAACVWLVERLPYVLDGVVEARLDLPRARLSLQWRPAEVALSEVVRWLARFGYAAHPTRGGEQGARTEAERRLLLKMGVCWALAGNVMLLAFALYSGLDLARDPALATAARWMSLVLAVPAVLYGGEVFLRRAGSSLALALQTRDFRRLHIDTPIALGILVGFGHSTWATFTGRGEVWFDSITVLIAALLTARWLQLRSRRFAGDATERLLALIPSMVRRVGPQGTVEVVRAAEVRVEDVVEVPAGEVIPVDGVVCAGTSMLNNAVLTGESRPERVGPGAAVEAGATNLSAPVRVRVRAVGEATRVGRLLAWVRDQEGRRAPVVLLADRLSGVFVLAVLALAALTAALWLWLAPAEAAHHVVALLVITCPCALGMATPLAMTVAAGRAARAGIFIKSDEATQQLTEVDCIVLDKTGTLTEGAMTLVDYEGEAHALDLAAVLERESSHPIAEALVRAHRVPGLQASDVAVEAGAGIQGQVAGHAVVVGRMDWVAAQAAGPSPGQQAALGRYAAQGYTPVAVAVDGRFAAVLAVGDRLRASTGPLLRSLQGVGKELYVLSGDHPAVVRAVAEGLGLSALQARGGVSPEEKRAFVEGLQRAGRTVAMVGDGVNDAAALQAADVGIAVHGGSTASMVAADVFLTREGLRPLADLFGGAARVMRVIRRNLALSLAYNVLGAGAAMLGLVSPLVAAVAMPLSSLAVVVSSVAQRSFRPAPLPEASAQLSAAAPDEIRPLLSVPAPALQPVEA